MIPDTRNSRHIRSFLVAPWRQVAHVGAPVILVVCILTCGAYRTEHSGATALVLNPLDALIHVTVLQTILIVLLMSIGACWAVWRTVASVRALRMVRLPPPPGLLVAANGIAPSQAIYLLLEDRPNAACLGLWRPAIYVTSGMLEQAAPEALRAAIAHEEMHRRRRDPLRLLAMRVLASRLYLLPWVARLPQRLELRAEILADRFARAHTSTAPLAAAILVVARGRAHDTRPAPSALSAPYHTDLGVAHLYGSATGVPRESALDERLGYLLLPASTPLPRLLPNDVWLVPPLSTLRAHWKVSVSLVGALALAIFLPITALAGSVPAILDCPLHLV